jgi:RNA polymerase sigma factor (sigma-70 family)
MVCSQTTRTSEATKLCKLEPTAKMADGAIQRRLMVEDAQWLRRRLLEPIECVLDDSFAAPEAERRYLAQLDYGMRTRFVGLTPSKKRADGRPRPLTLADERELFLRFNYFRHRTMAVLAEYAGRRLSLGAAREVVRWGRLADAMRDQIVDANLGLVPTMVERSRIRGVDFGDLISEGQYALLRSVDKFDCGRGFKFSTYACRAILTSITRCLALVARHRSRFPTDYDPSLERGDYVQQRRAGVEEDWIEELQDLVRGNTADLTRTERHVLNQRFGLRPGARRMRPTDPKTLRQVAEQFGVTKERVRQIQNKALGKLRLELDRRVERTSPGPRS